MGKTYAAMRHSVRPVFLQELVLSLVSSKSPKAKVFFPEVATHHSSYLGGVVWRLDPELGSNSVAGVQGPYQEKFSLCNIEDHPHGRKSDVRIHRLTHPALRPAYFCIFSSELVGHHHQDQIMAGQLANFGLFKKPETHYI